MRALLAIAVLSLFLSPAFAQKDQMKKQGAKQPFNYDACMQRFAKQGMQAYDATRKCMAKQRRS
jgi:hypothetical protein